MTVYIIPATDKQIDDLREVATGPYRDKAMLGMGVVLSVIARLDAEKARADAAEKDAARLNWLDAECSQGNGLRMCCLSNGLRDAIDAAMQAKP